ncbi:beta galactofuranosyl transferase [Leptomonas seymouri]|uniref:Beta galactofuranosyl transferase n=1 Tax=Leptomonas seymouri TaxID=5684 RepID=A0A0N1PES8_LEPSE|nr:beta galactofuranosyl transferase [Leptomonas seymouri]|eukprot:KPI89304.1 beta galactofuranosyl transferase [Leptomonas seymouri]
MQSVFKGGAQSKMSPSRMRVLVKHHSIWIIISLLAALYLFSLLWFYKRSLADTFVDAPRKGETFISDEGFFACVRARLSHSSEDPGRIPFFLAPVTMDYQDLKQLFCNITVPITYIMLINNGEFKPLRDLLERLEKKLPTYMNKNLFIIHHPENIGYAAAVNEGLRRVLTYPVKEVPWVFITNMDVRFGGTLISEFVQNVNEKTDDQKEWIARLNREVAKEAVNLINVTDPRFTYRSSQSPIVTAPSLPHRIRVMPYSEMRTQFAGIYGMFFPNSEPHMATFALSRLTLETVGFFDENYYPAYGEDHDYVWRMHALGFLDFLSPKGRYVHFHCANLEVNAEVLTRGVAKYTAYTAQSLKFHRMNHQPYRLYYRKVKWFPDSRLLEPEDGPERSLLPFRGSIPVDLWVLDPNRRESIRLVGEGKLCRRHYRYYDMNLLNFTSP